MPGCPNKVWLEIHHLERFARGGKTEPENLVCLCSSCHKNVHRGLLRITQNEKGTLLYFDQDNRRLDLQTNLEIANWLDYEVGWTGGEENSYAGKCYGGDWMGLLA